MSDHQVARRRQRERGQTMWLVALCLLVLIGMAALAIDVTTLYAARSQMQRTADAAALAGAKAFVDSGTTTDPANATLQTLAQNLAGNAANGYIGAVLAQNKINGVAPGLATAPTFDFTTHPGNPEITVTVQRTNLPTFFARIFGQTLATVSATATAEAYNSSNPPGGGSNMPPISPSCVKPWLVPNMDPSRAAYDSFLDATTGTITHPGVSTGPGTGGVIGEQLTLANVWHAPAPHCNGTPNCGGLVSPLTLMPSKYVGYLPANPPSPVSGACPACSVGLPSPMSEACACCDTANTYQCGSTTANVFIELTHERWVSTLEGASCLMTGTAINNGTAGDDTINLSNFLSSSGPALIQAGTGSHSTQYVTTSNQIITLPIIDVYLVSVPTGQVKVIGFMQAFLERTSPDGDLVIDVLNISGCGSNVNTSATPIYGGGVSPVPVRLVHN
jgi:Flp pilus assembly protein TadG